MHQCFVSPENELTLYEDVLVDPATALIVRSDGTPVIEQADEVLFWTPRAYDGALRSGADPHAELEQRMARITSWSWGIGSRLPTAMTLPADVSYVYMAHPFSWHPYGHLFDSLQRLKHGLAAPGQRVVLHSKSSKVVGFDEHLGRLGATAALPMNPRILYRVPKLWVSPWQAPPAQLSEECLDWIFERYTAGIPETAPLRLYLSRNHVKPGQRGVLNEDAVLQHLAPLGFTVVTGREPLREIIEKFYNAEIIVGPHGSLFANCMFTRERCTVIEFCPDNRADMSFKLKRKKAREYRQIFLPGDESWNISIPVDRLAAELDTALVAN